jgi:mediator of RNA polymerase II transcription subunit 4
MSIREELGGLLQEFVSTSSNLIDSLVAVTEGKKSRNPEEIMTEAIEIDKKVKISIAKLAEQQEFYKKIIHVQTLIAEKDREVNQLAGQLKDVELTLQSVLDESKAELESLEKSEKSPVSVEDLVEYAHRVSGTTSAPPQDMDLVDAPRVFKHPFPTATQIQQSLLHLETNPAAVSSAPSAPLDQEYSANMNAPRTAQSADMQKDDMGGEAMDTEMNHEEDNHYGMDTDHQEEDQQREAANITDIFADLNPDLQ